MLQNRPPIIVILGHVDHGKTTLLDHLRKSNVAAREAGGITQHIRSFQLALPNSSPLTFIDTPGHAAFSAIRSRGGQIADLALLIISGPEGVMPQTKQSLEFIKSAKLPFVVVVTKADLPNSNPDRIKTQLTENQVIVEEFGGNVPLISVSAKTGAGIPELLELIHLIIDLNPPQSDPDGPPELIVLESRMDPHQGPTATVLVKTGTLKVGDPLFQAHAIGKTRALVSAEGNRLTQAEPARPVEIVGLSTLPLPGTSIFTSPSSIASTSVSATKPLGESTSLKIVLKADVAGSLEAIVASLPTDIAIIAEGTGDVTETDVSTAETAPATIICFNTKASASVAKLAETSKVKILRFTIIYELLDALDKLAHPEVKEELLGQASIIAEFKMNADHVAGCRVLSGVLEKGQQVKLLRKSDIIGTAKIRSLHQAKSVVDKVKAGLECGLTLSPNIEFQIGDDIISYIIHGQA